MRPPVREDGHPLQLDGARRHRDALGESRLKDAAVLR
jgi:hypothetical protein